MKISTKITIILTVSILLLAFQLKPVHAFEFKSGSTVTIPSKSVTNGSLLISGNQLVIDGKVDGDLICAGKQVTIIGDVTGDIICAAQDITITNTTQGNLRLIGQRITIASKIARNSTVFGQDLNFTPTATVSGESLFAAQTATISGTILKNIQGWGESLNIAAKIGGNASFEAQTFTLDSQSHITGNLDYRTPSQQILPGVVNGKVSFEKSTIDFQSYIPPTSQQFSQAINQIGIFLMITKFMTTLIFGMFIWWLFPGFIEATNNVLSSSLSKVLEWGLVIEILAIITLVVLLFSVIGVPLALLEMLIWILMAFVIDTVIASFVGYKLLAKAPRIITFTLGLIAITAFTQIPIAGGMFSLLFSFAGLGAIFLVSRQK